MTKLKPRTKPSVTKASVTEASVTKAAASKTSASKRSAAPAANGTPLIVLGFDEQQKPRGARFDGANPDLVAKAADLMGFKVYRATAPDLAAAAKKPPVGRLYTNGRGFVPNIRQSLYSDLIVELVGDETQPLPGSADDKDALPPARGLPLSWDEIGPGHLVVAQEAPDYGWWEAVVLDRKDETLILRFRDYPHLPKFARHLSGIALMYPPGEERRPEAQPDRA